MSGRGLILSRPYEARSRPYEARSWPGSARTP
jgi:hypothetical protein